MNTNEKEQFQLHSSKAEELQSYVTGVETY